MERAKVMMIAKYIPEIGYDRSNAENTFYNSFLWLVLHKLHPVVFSGWSFFYLQILYSQLIETVRHTHFHSIIVCFDPLCSVVTLS